MIALEKRLKKLEQMYCARGGIFTAFQSGARMKISGGGLNFNGSMDEGEKILTGLPEGALLVRFNIPRPEMLETETVLWET